MLGNNAFVPLSDFLYFILEFITAPRMRHCIEQSNGLVPSLLCPSWVDYIIVTRI
jgi:hypothetical protein